MNTVFEQKNLWEKIFGPLGPPTEKMSDLAWAGPAGPPGGPKVVKIVPLGSLTLLKTVGHPQKMVFLLPNTM